jgi:ferredoxin
MNAGRVLGSTTMADPNEKYEDNAPGPFYVDKGCLICHCCILIAPSIFKESDDQTHARVYKQPETPEEFALARQAIQQCPLNAIGEEQA